VAQPRTDLFNPNIIRASLGTVFTRPVCTATTVETLEWLRARGLAIYAARPDARLVYTEVNLAKPAAIVVGSEAAGLSPAWRGDDVTAIKLPMHGTADSLNVSATCAVLFYEALRQRERVQQQ
jgi:TrmH family RNA methyltransferase